MHDVNRTANLLGATALAVTDLALTGATKAAGVSASGAAALVALSAAPGLSVTELGRRVGLSQPAAARMVDSLQAGGLVERSQGPGRWVSVSATAAGRRTAEELLAARGGPLAEIVGTMEEKDRRALDALLFELLTRLYGKSGDASLMCRLCDRECCVHGGAVCPVGQAERAEAGGEGPCGGDTSEVQERTKPRGRSKPRGG